MKDWISWSQADDDHGFSRLRLNGLWDSRVTDYCPKGAIDAPVLYIGCHGQWTRIHNFQGPRSNRAVVYRDIPFNFYCHRTRHKGLYSSKDFPLTPYLFSILNSAITARILVV